MRERQEKRRDGAVITVFDYTDEEPEREAAVNDDRISEGAKVVAFKPRSER